MPSNYAFDRPDSALSWRAASALGNCAPTARGRAHRATGRRER